MVKFTVRVLVKKNSFSENWRNFAHAILCSILVCPLRRVNLSFERCIRPLNWTFLLLQSSSHFLEAVQRVFFFTRMLQEVETTLKT